MTNPTELSGQAFLDWQLEHRYDAHVAPLNRWIDERNEASAPEWLPFISPIHGGVNARIITLLRDPGPQVAHSKMLSVRNEDQSASTQLRAVTNAGLSASSYTPWNSYPWYRKVQKDKLTTVEQITGAPLVLDLMALLPEVRVLILHGDDAAETWWRVSKLDPRVESRHDLTVLRTFHSSASGTRGTVAEKEAKIAHIEETWARAAELTKRQ